MLDNPLSFYGLLYVSVYVDFHLVAPKLQKKCSNWNRAVVVIATTATQRRTQPQSPSLWSVKVSNKPLKMQSNLNLKTNALCESQARDVCRLFYLCISKYKPHLPQFTGTWHFDGDSVSFSTSFSISFLLLLLLIFNLSFVLFVSFWLCTVKRPLKLLMLT